MSRSSRELASHYTWRNAALRKAREIVAGPHGQVGSKAPTLCCPACLSNRLTTALCDLEELASVPDTELSCPKCDEVYPVRRGIPVMVPSSHRTQQNLPRDEVTTEHTEYETYATKKVARILRRFSSGFSLDVGCGKGPYSGYFGGDLVLCDINYYFVEEAVRRYAGDHHVYGVVADATGLPFAGNSFDLVFCSSMVEHLKPTTVDRVLDSFKCMTREWLMVDVPNDTGLVKLIRKVLARANVFDNPDYEDEALKHHISFSPGALRARGFSVRGCIGWVSRRRFRAGLIWDLYDFLVGRAPFLAGTIIGIFLKSSKDEQHA